MGPMWGEIDDLSLMEPEDAVRASGHEQRQMGERAEAAVAQEDIVLAELRMDLRHPGHVMSA